MAINEIRLTLRVCVCDVYSIYYVNMSAPDLLSLSSPANPLGFSFSLLSCKSAFLFEFYLHSKITRFFLKLSDAPTSKNIHLTIHLKRMEEY